MWLFSNCQTIHQLPNGLMALEFIDLKVIHVRTSYLDARNGKTGEIHVRANRLNQSDLLVRATESPRSDVVPPGRNLVELARRCQPMFRRDERVNSETRPASPGS